jgi:integrase
MARTSKFGVTWFPPAKSFKKVIGGKVHYFKHPNTTEGMQAALADVERIKAGSTHPNSLPIRQAIESNKQLLELAATTSAPWTKKIDREQIRRDIAALQAKLTTGDYPLKEWNEDRSQIGAGEVQELSLTKLVKAFLLRTKARVKAGKLTQQRYLSLEHYCNKFAEWAACDLLALNGQKWLAFHTALTGDIEKGMATATARTYFGNVKAFLNDTYANEVHPTWQLPRNFAKLKVESELQEINPWSPAEFKQLLAVSNKRQQLYWLLQLNCAFTSKDVCDLLQSEVDWEKGTITRKRSKHQHRSGKTAERIPTVTYKLWRTTFQLLKAQRPTDSKFALLSTIGTELGGECASGRKDQVKDAWTKFVKKRLTGNKHKIKELRKSGVSALADNHEFDGIKDLLLGNTPSGNRERSYEKPSQDRLDKAVRVIGDFYGIA